MKGLILQCFQLSAFMIKYTDVTLYIQHVQIFTPLQNRDVYIFTLASTIKFWCALWNSVNKSKEKKSKQCLFFKITVNCLLKYEIPVWFYTWMIIWQRHLCIWAFIFHNTQCNHHNGLHGLSLLDVFSIHLLKYTKIWFNFIFMARYEPHVTFSDSSHLQQITIL